MSDDKKKTIGKAAEKVVSKDNKKNEKSPSKKTKGLSADSAQAKNKPEEGARKIKAEMGGKPVEARVTPNEGRADNWALQADRMAVRLPLVECLRLLAGHYGRRASIGSLTAGLPIPRTGITPDLFIRAAERADLNAKLVDSSLEALAIAPNLPCVLSLEQGGACILWSVDEDADNGSLRFNVQFPETSEEKQNLSFEELAKLYTGYSFFLRPVARSDERAGPAEIDTGRDWFWATFKKNKTIYSEVGIAAFMINVFGLTSSVYIMNVYDRVVPNAAFDTLYALTFGVAIVYIFDFLLRNLRAHFLDHAGRRADVNISASLFEQVMGMTMAERPPSAGVLASNMKEFESLRDFFTSATMVALIDLPFVLVFIGVIALIGGPIAFVPLVAIPLVVGLGFYMQKPLREVTQQSLHENALKNALLFETIIGLETIKVQAAEGNIQRRWEELTEKASRIMVKSRQLSAFTQNWAVFIQQLVSVGIVFVGVFMIAEGLITQGALVACVLLSGRTMGPLAQISGLLTRLSQSREALVQLDDLMRKPVERPAGKHFVSFPNMHGRVEFRDVVFAYPGQETPSLKEVSFLINPGERIGIIGAVGSGKTTLERLLLNLYAPTSGSVQIDGTDVRQIDPGDLRRNIGAVQQSPQLFYGSVRENITMGHEMAPDRAVLKAAELSGVMEFLRESSAGLDTQVGERGEALSGGQRQAVAIARSLLYDPPILVFDEPTASLDPASEMRLRRRLDVLCQNKTVIVITHKGAMLELVDKLILLDRGQVVAYGPKAEVIKKLQAREYKSGGKA